MFFDIPNEVVTKRKIGKALGQLENSGKIEKYFFNGYFV